MGASHACSPFIPLSSADLVELLLADRTVSDEDRALFRDFSALVQAIHHLEYHGRLVNLKSAYVPFDPDVDDTRLIPLTAAQKQQRLNELWSHFAWLLDQAHYVHLGRVELEKVLAHASEWGIRMDLDFSVFEHLAIFARGDTYERRIRRNWRTWFQPEEVEVPIYRRLVLILKLRPHPRLSGPIHADHVLLKIFKDIPKMDIDMLLPGARVTLSLLDRGKIAGGFVSGIGTMLYNLAGELINAFPFGFSEKTLWALAAGSFGYGYKTWYGYRQTKQAYHLALTQSLYFQNLDSNAGVLTRLFDEAEEQATRFTLLGYFCLFRFAKETGWTADELDGSMELFLDRYADLQLLCERGKALARLRLLGLVEPCGDRFRAVPLSRARGMLQLAWERCQPGSPAALP